MVGIQKQADLDLFAALVFGMILGRQPADWKKNETALYHWTTDTPASFTRILK